MNHVIPFLVLFFSISILQGCRRTERVDPPVETPPQATASGVQLPVDFTGKAVDLLQHSDARATVLLFVSIDCPISNRYAPEIHRIIKTFHPKKVAFWLVYPDADASIDAIREHMFKYQYQPLPIGSLRDPEHFLVKRAKATVTPEAAVFDGKQRLVYHGRIDNRYVDFGQARPAPTKHDLQAALKAVLEGRPIPQSNAAAVGCYIPELPGAPRISPKNKPQE